MKLQVKFGLLLLACVGLLSACIPGFAPDRYASYRCSDGSTAVVDYATSPPLVTVGSTTHRLVQLQSNGRWTTDGLLTEISINDQNLNLYEIAGLITISCQRV